jgi:malate permease and related proteins
MIVEILSVIVPVLIVIGLGYLWARIDMPFDREMIGSLVLRIGVPGLIFSTLTTADINPGTVGMMALYAALVIAICALVGIVILRAAGLPLHTYLLSAMHGNSGNMGLALAAMVFGTEGLALAIAFFLVVSISQNSLGILVSSGSLRLLPLVREPILIASAVTLAFILADWPVPQWLAHTTDLVGSFVIPLMLILLGVSLARLEVSDLRVAGGISLLRGMSGAGAALLVILAFGLTGAQAGVVFIMATMPVAVLNFIYAERFDRSPERVAGVIVVSTVGTLAVLPVIVWAALWMAEA